MLSNWDTAKQYVKDYKDGLTVGSAEKENLQYLDSIQGKWNVISENLKGIGNTLITSDMVKGSLDIGIVLSEGFNKGIQGLTKGVSSVLKGNLFTDISTSISDKLYGIFEKINLGKGLQGILDGLFGNLSIFDGFGNKLATSLSNSIGKAFSFALSQTSMGKALKPIMDMLNVDGLFKGKKLNNQIDSRNENINAIKSEVQSLKNQKQAIEDILPTYDKLSQKTKLSANESQQLVEMRNQLADSNPDLVLEYDKNGAPILKNLQIQNKQLESQIKLKQQSQRLEENSLALDTLQRQTLGQKEFNKAYKEYNNMQLASNTKRKEGLFGKESTQDYAKRIIDDNKKITEANQKAYDQRLKDHQQYVQDEKAIQQKYMNEMTQKSSFNRLSEEMKSGMLTFMDALDWSQFSPAEGNQFAGMLANLGDKFAPTTKAMGKQSKAIAQLTQDYADGKTNLINYTKGLTEQYEAAGKFDAESFSAWRQGLQSYVDTTGDLQGANRAINEMATSLHKITGIDTSTWKTALSFDPAPIDASNKALQKFLNSYGTGVQNWGKGGLADQLTSQFETLQNSYMQMTSDLAEGKEIDVKYLVNATIGNPEAIQNLVKEITSDGEVTEEEMELLLNVQAELLNGGEITDETISKIAEEFDMTETEVRTMLNVKTEVKNVEEVQSIWENIKDKTVELITNVIGKENVEKIKSTWETVKNKVVDFTVKLIGQENIEKLKTIWENLKNKTIELVTKVKDFDFKEAFGNLKNKVIELTVKLIGEENIEKLKAAWENFKTKTVELITKIKNFDLVETLKTAWEDIKNKAIELSVKLIGEENIEKLKEAWNTFTNKVVELAVKVKEEVLPKVKEMWDSFVDKVVGLTIEAKETAISNAKELWDKFVDKTVGLTVELIGKENIEKAKEMWNEFVDKAVNLTMEVRDAILSTAKEMWESFKDKTVSLTMSIIDAGIAEAKEAWNSFVNKTVSLTCSILNGTLVEDFKNNWKQITSKTVQLIASVVGGGTIINLKGIWASIVSKTVSITASVVGSGLVSALKSAWESIKSKAVALTASVSGSGLVNALKSAWQAIKSKAVNLAASVTGTGLVNALKSSWQAIKSKAVKLSASVSGTGAVSALKGLWNSIVSKTVTLTTKVVKTTTNIINTVFGKSSIDEPIKNTLTFDKKPINYSPIVTTTPILENSPLVNVPITMSTSPLSSIPVSASEGSSTPLSNMPVSIRANNDFGGTIDKNKILPSLDFDISHIKDLEEALKRIGKQLDFLDEKSKAIFGNEKLSLLQQQIPLLKEQQKIQEQIAKNERAQNNELEYWLAQQGFNFDNLGSITNYNDKLLSMEKNVELLKKKYDDLNDVQGDKKNENAIKSAQKAYESANDTLSKTKKYLEEYFSTSNEELIEASKKWWEYENQITEVEESIRELLNLQLVNQIDSVSDSIDFLDSKIKALNGQDKIQYLQQQNELYKQQQQLLHELAEQMRSQLVTLNPLSEAYKELSSDIIDLSTQWWDLYGSIQDNNESIFEINKDKKTNGIKNDIDLLEDQIKFFDEKMEGYSGSIRIEYIEEQIKLYKEQQKQMHTLADELRNQLTLLDPMSDEYKEMQSEILKLSTDWWTVENSINDARDEIEELNREIELLSVDSKLKEIEVQFTRLEHELNLIDTKLEYAFGTDKIDLMTESIALMNKQLDMQQEKLGLTNQRFAIYQDDLRKYGFQFDKMGNMTNYSQMMDVYKNSDDLEKLLDLTKEYTDIQNDLRDLTEEYWDLSDAIKDTYNEQLEITKDIEDEITDIIKKEKERREKEIQDYTDERIKLLQKEKEQYQEMRSEQNYNKSVKEQTDEIAELQKRIETLKKDSTISGQKKLKELMDELADKQKELEETTQDRIDKNYENNIDNEIDKLEEEEEKLIEILDEKFSEENIAKMVAEAMASGVININGEIKTLQDALLDSINNSVEGYSVLGNVIKNELVANLNVALNTMQELDSIYSNLGLNDYTGVSSSIKLNTNIPSSSNNKSVTIGDTHINVTGSVDNTTLEKIKELIKESQDEMLEKITYDL